MDKEKYTADFGSMHERIGGLFKEMAADFFDDTWADTFTLEETGKKNVTVIYHGKEDFKRFKKENTIGASGENAMNLISI